jgi:DNA-binding GntR family transcriptional regulator
MRPLTLSERPRSLTDVVYETIHAAIVGRVMAPGEALSEPDVAERLGVSKTPVREAFLRLRASGLLEPDGARGVRVVRFSLEKLDHAYELREAVEPFMAARCAERAGGAMRRQVSEAAARSLAEARAGEQERFRSADVSFHAAIASTIANPRMTEAVGAARALIAALSDRDVPHAEAAVMCGEDHVRIATAIERGQAERASAEMASHVRRVRDLVVAAASDG